MGIKTKFSPMGGGSESDKGNLNDWRYSNEVIPGKTLLYNYTGSWTKTMYEALPKVSPASAAYFTSMTPSLGDPAYFANGTKRGVVNNLSPLTVRGLDGSSQGAYFAPSNAVNVPITIYVPKAKGKTVINDWVSAPASGTQETNRNTPFHNNRSVVSVDLQKVPFRNNSMGNAFNWCHNLLRIEGINPNVTNMCATFFQCDVLNQNIQIPNSVTNMNGTFYSCHNFNQNIQIPNSVTDMSSTFYSCYNFNQNIQIPNSVTDMSSTFYECTILNQNIQIPNSVTNMSNTFNFCVNLNQNIQIPNSVTTMASTFQSCHNLNQNIQIPNSVTSMLVTFQSCYNLNQNIQIPNSVTSMLGTFNGCHNLNQNIQIPNSVTGMTFTFRSCYNLNQNIQIPNNVTSMDSTFQLCYNLGSFINVRSSGVSVATNIFYRNNTSAAIPNVIIPCRYINNTLTATYNSLKTAGWTFAAAGTGTSIGPANSKVVGWDFVGGDFNTFLGNGTHWILSKWNGGLQKARNGGTVITDIVVPNSITSYDTFPTAINYPCFQANTTITSVECNNVPWAGTTMVNAFRGCTALKRVSNIRVQEGITSYATLFYADTALESATSAGRTEQARTVNIRIPNSVTTASSMLAQCKQIQNFNLVGGFGLTTITYLFDYCNTRDINVWLEAPNVTSLANVFRGYVKTQRKNVYIYFKYANGVGTKTFNSFCTAAFMGSTDKTNFANPRFNATTNIYFYNIGVCPV